MRRLRTLVTGGAGFIGSHVVDALLARGDEVHVVDNRSAGSRENLAAGTELHVLEAARAAGPRGVFTSSGAIYGECGETAEIFGRNRTSPRAPGRPAPQRHRRGPGRTRARLARSTPLAEGLARTWTALRT